MDPGDLSPHLPRVLVANGSLPRPTVVEVDGTLVFADLSGFTALNERLARRGRIGSELMTDVLNDRFGRLLGVVAAYDGDLLCYGGDAVLVLFGGEQHAERALTTAAKMRAALRGSAAGLPRVTLRMSTGVASGRIQLALVGRSYPLVVPFGPTVTRTLELEATANASQILADVPLGARRAVGVVSNEAEPGAVLVERLRRPLASGPELAPPPIPPGMGLDPFVLAAIQAGARAEHRLASIAFVKFQGTDALAADPDQAALVFDELVSAGQDACARHGVALLAIDVDRDGGKFFMNAGGLHATTDDETGLALAAREIVGTATPLRLRAGLNRGVVFAGPVGTATRQSFTTIGDATNTAARVMAAAPIGSVLASDGFLASSRTLFATTPVEPFAAKGKAEPIRAAIVGEPLGQRQNTPARLVGRERELASITAGLAAPRAVVVVSGEAGIGKTSVIRAVAAAWTAPVTNIEGGRYLALSPYGALRRPLAELLGVTDADDLWRLVARRSPELTDLAPLLGPLVGIDLAPTDGSDAVGPDFRRQRTLDVLLAVLAAEPPGRLVVVEDAHWLDDASTSVLGTMAARGPAWSYLVGTRPSDELRMGDAARISTVALGPVAPEAARQLVRGRAGDRPFAPATVDAIVAKAAGQPLFLAQLTEAVRRGADLDDLAEGLEPILAAILDQVDRAGRELTARGGVIGQRIDLDLFAALADIARGELRRRLATLDALFELAPDEARFVHAVLRDAAYGSLPYRRRVELHARVADLLAANPDAPVELRAIHEQRAHRWERAFPMCVEAARRSRNAAAPVEAIRFYADALDARRHLGLDTREAGAEVAGEQAELLRMVGRPEEALRAIAQGLRLTGDPTRRLHLRLLRNRTRIDLGQLRRAVSSLKRMSDDGSMSTPERCWIVADLAAALRQQGRSRAAVERLERDADLAASRDEAAAAVMAQMAMALGEIGDPRALEVSRQAMAMTADKRRRATMHNNIGIELYYVSRWEEAVVSFEAALVDFTAVGDNTEAARVVNNLAEIALDQRRYDAAAEELELAHDTFAAGHHAYGMILVLTNQARLAVATGHLDDARSAIDATRRWQAVAATTFNAREVDAAECELLLGQGREMQMAELATSALTAADDRDTAGSVRARLLRLRGEATSRRNDPQSVVDLRTAAEMARAAGSPYEEALAVLALDPTDPTALATLTALGVSRGQTPSVSTDQPAPFET